MAARRYRIALYPGDGIGTDVTAEAARVLAGVSRRHGFFVDTTAVPWGCLWAREHGGHPVPADFLEHLRPFDAIFLGALGMPAMLPDHVTLAPLIRMRQEFRQYVCLRPAVLMPGTESPLADRKPGDVDMVIVRENSEGEYTGAGGCTHAGSPEEISVQVAVHTRRGVERILRYGFELARRRRQCLTMATKSNALNHSMVMWDRILDAVRGDYPDVQAGKVHIDALAMLFVRTPEAFDVVVASNLFGDILSDLAGALVGSLGLAPSANINPDRDCPSLFEPVHGSAPDIAGQGVANPIAAIRSAAMMLDFLGETDAAREIERAVADNLRHGSVRTPDLAGTATTVQVGNDILQRLSD
ncbi:MAG: tartrate dehydrogenase [Lentisphaeria bacterium]|nr:tartrate dehydrogenase [Lentisphaeria bacterium]